MDHSFLKNPSLISFLKFGLGESMYTFPDSELISFFYQSKRIKFKPYKFSNF
jgi:hypothetical protein